jgi:hypothetical protein
VCLAVYIMCLSCGQVITPALSMSWLGSKTPEWLQTNKGVVYYEAQVADGQSQQEWLWNLQVVCHYIHM